ncbi:MAG: segregation ATPase FtsK/SpoIIIE, family [Patescibacteria group bacterium]|nr:segregation ATPase FtsK/SpoIIIE, family [Patescibacteria group bacterium]
MAKKSKKESTAKFDSGIGQETLQAVFAILSFVLALLSVLAAFDKAGFVGEYFFNILKWLLGLGYFLLPVMLVMLGVAFLKGIKRKFEMSKLIGALLFFFSGLGLVELLVAREGGVLGYYIAHPLISLIEVYATAAVLIACVAISILITFQMYFTLEHLMFWNWFKKDVDEENALKDANSEEKIDKAVGDVENKLQKEQLKIAEQIQNIKKPEKINKDEVQDIVINRAYSLKAFTPPPLSLLEKDKGKPETGDIKANANIIKRTLQNFGISVEMDEISIGPSVTRYALKPAEGVKLSKIVGLNNDLALALAAHPIRIEAPIPGKSLVGIEIPNTTKTTVGLGTLLGSDEYQESEKPLLISLGKGISGKSYFSNLAKAPHMLIAGATGSGKSVTIHAIITSLLFRNSPENLKFIMIDPKRVELTLYNKIPHLLTPVITDAKKAILALKWAAKEMSRRYDTLEKCTVRDIDSYHKSILGPAIERKDEKMPESMPYIVIVLDELADIMQTYPRELESAIVRLAQMSRAVGIHLILSTQRPSVNVITGLIKANVPTRVALQVSAQIDSRTILDTGGAEKLLGAGDMLYLGGEMSKPQRLQSAYITEAEVKKVVKYLADAYKDEVMGEINLTVPEAGKDSIFSAEFDSDNADIGDEDELLAQAREIVISSGKASTSWLQRKLSIGYSRAAKLIDLLETKGVVGPANGSKPREVYGVADSAQSSDSSSESSPASEEPNQ